MVARESESEKKKHPPKRYIHKTAIVGVDAMLVTCVWQLARLWA